MKLTFMWKFLNFFSKKSKKQNGLFISIPSDGLDETFLFDFKNYQSGYNNAPNGTAIWADGESPENEKSISSKIKAKPIDVLNELETIPTPISLTNLDDKIAILKLKEKHIVQNFSKREVQGIIERLENRKKYNKFKPFFEIFQYTNDEKIDKLLSKYDLLMKTTDLFIPEFPDEAIKIMENYSEKVFELSGKKAIYYVIATEEKFRKAYEKRDPILLAQCPFSYNWQILGAWDKEMMLLYEL